MPLQDPWVGQPGDDMARQNRRQPAGLQWRDLREMMEWPFVSLSKAKRLKPIRHCSRNGKVWVEVHPSAQHGMATIWDYDLVIWIISKLMEQRNAGKKDILRILTFHPHDLLSSIGRKAGGHEYARFKDALCRLQGTRIRTNIRAASSEAPCKFTLIESWAENRDEETGRLQGVIVTISDWIHEGILMEGGALAISPDYFRLTGGLERALYRIARKHVPGAGPTGFRINLDTLWKKTGAAGSYRRFKHDVRWICEANPLPGYRLEWATAPIGAERQSRGEPQICMVKRP